MSYSKAKSARDPSQASLRQVSAKIRAELAAQGMSVDALALKIGVARSTLREIVAGRSNPRLLTVLAIAQGLGHPDLRSFFAEN